MTSPDQVDHDHAAEQAVLGAIIVSGGRALDELEDFSPSDYHRPQHEEIHRALAGMARRKEPIDLASVGPVIETIRGMTKDYAIDLSQACSHWSVAAHFAAKVARHATVRRGRGVGTQLAGMDPALALDPDSLNATLDDARAALDNLGAARRATVTTFADVADQAIDCIGNLQFTPTPWKNLNHLINGWSPALMYVLGARPATGKTVVSVQAAIDFARQQGDLGGLAAAYYTFEMSGPRLYQRALANVGAVDIKKLHSGELSEAEWRAISRADGQLRELPVVVEGSAGWTAQHVISHAKAAHRKHPLGLIVVDHIGRVAPGQERRHSREQEVADAANRFLDMAQELNAAVLVCTQLNRQPAQRADPRPVATDIRESDVLEQNADCVILMHRDREKTPSDLDLLVAKNRDGQDGPVALTFEGHYSRAIDREWTPHSSARDAA